MTSAEILQWVVALGLGAVIQQIVRFMTQRKKMGADAAKAITDAATILVEPLKKRVEELQLEVAHLRGELAEASRRAEHAEEVARLVADTAHRGQSGLAPGIPPRGAQRRPEDV